MHAPSLCDQPVKRSMREMIPIRTCFSRRQLRNHSSTFYRIKRTTFSGVGNRAINYAFSGFCICQAYNSSERLICDLHKPKYYACFGSSKGLDEPAEICRLEFAIAPTNVDCDCVPNNL